MNKDTVQLKKANVLAKKDISISGSDVTLEGDTNTRTSTTLHEVKTSELTVALGDTVMSAANTAIDLKNHAKNRNDKRLAALEYVEAEQELEGTRRSINDYRSLEANMRKAAEAEKEYGNALLASNDESERQLGQQKIDHADKQLADLDGDKNALKAKQKAEIDKLVNISISIGSSSSKSETKVHEITYEGGKLVAGNGIQVSAASKDTAKGNLTTIAETIAGKKVSLQADNNVNLLAGTHTTKITEDSKNTGWSVGTSIGLASGSLMGLNASAYKATENGVTDMTTHAGTMLTGADSVSISSGQDTNIIGSKVKGNTVAMNVGKDLNITSLQDTKTYKNRSSSSGMSISTNFTAVGTMGSISSSKGKMDSTYASVTEQAGIYAGNGGFTENTKGTTTLTGAVIDSTLTGKEANDKNTLTTGKLVMKDVENTASYSAKRTTRGMSSSLKGISPLSLLQNLPQFDIPVSGEDSSTTQAAIAEGVIRVADISSVEAINRDTKHALNELHEIFDKTAVEEKQALANAISRQGFKLVGDIAMKKQRALTDKYVETMIQADVALKNGDKTLSDTLTKKANGYRQEAKKWEDGGIYKVALHGVTGAIVSDVAGAGLKTGFVSAATNESLQGILGKIKNPKLHKLASAIVGKLVVDNTTGQAIAQQATKYNGLNHVQQSLDANEPQNTIVQYLESNINQKKKDGIIYVLRSAKIMSTLNLGIGEDGEEPFINLMNRSAEVLGLSYRYDWNDTVNNNLTAILREIDGGDIGSFALKSATSAVTSSMDYKASKIAKKTVPVGTAISGIVNISKDTDVQTYGINNNKTRFIADLGYTAWQIYIGRKTKAMTSFGAGVITDKEFENFKDKVAPPLTKEEIKREYEEEIDAFIKRKKVE